MKWKLYERFLFERCALKQEKQDIASVEVAYEKVIFFLFSVFFIIFNLLVFLF